MIYLVSRCRQVTLLVVALLVATMAVMAVSLCAIEAQAAPQSSYTLGLAAYKKGDYKSAAQCFQKSISSGNKEAIAFLYLSHAFLGCGDKSQAIKSYCDLMNKFPQSPEARLAVQCVQRIDPVVAQKYASLLQVPASVASAPDGLIARMIIVEPKFGHPPVSQATIATVKRAVRSLSPQIYKLLNASGSTLNLAPNTIDKWPGTGDESTGYGDGRVCGEAAGHTYHRDGQGPDIYIFERCMVRGTTQLKEPYTQSNLFEIALHEMGHGVDDLLGCSKDPKYLAEQKADANALSAADRTEWSYYVVPMEACAEITGGLAGYNEKDSTTANVIRCFPRTTRWLKQRLQL
jgi:tetratricopeptide (TPR) repeat protein